MTTEARKGLLSFDEYYEKNREGIEIEKKKMQDERDAERYRWLRTAGAWNSEIGMDDLSEEPEKFDAAVDEQMAYDKIKQQRDRKG